METNFIDILNFHFIIRNQNIDSNLAESIKDVEA